MQLDDGTGLYFDNARYYNAVKGGAWEPGFVPFFSSMCPKDTDASPTCSSTEPSAGCPSVSGSVERNYLHAERA